MIIMILFFSDIQRLIPVFGHAVRFCFPPLLPAILSNRNYDVRKASLSEKLFLHLIVQVSELEQRQTSDVFNHSSSPSAG